MLRRNLDVNILLFNNEIYGLTKGQYSPTSRVGLKTKATPYGSIDSPFDPISLALGAGASFVGRTIDNDQKHMAKVFKAAAAHKGTSFVEIFQNCVIFNDGVFDEVADKKVRAEKTIALEEGQPMVYGAERDKGLRVRNYQVERCNADEADVWNPATESSAPSMVLAEIQRGGDLPTPVGILRQKERPLFESAVHAQVKEQTEKRGKGNLKDLVYAGETWTVS